MTTNYCDTCGVETDGEDNCEPCWDNWQMADAEWEKHWESQYEAGAAEYELDCVVWAEEALINPIAVQGFDLVDVYA